MMVSTSSTVSGKEYSDPNEKLICDQQLEPFSLTRTSSSSSSVSGSHNESIQSVPSLFEAMPFRRDHDSQLALTTEDLQIASKHSSGGCSTATVVHQHPIVASPTPGSMKPNKKKFVRHGVLCPSPAVTSEPQKNPKPTVYLNGGASGLQLRAKPTVTTILRQQHVLEKAEKKEKEKLESLMVSNAAYFEVDSLSKEQEKKEMEEAKAAESKRLLQAKLAYEKAIAASRKVTDEKQRIAAKTRRKEKEWQRMLEKQRESEQERRKAMAESLQRTHFDSKRAVDEMLRSKQLLANKVKHETLQLQAEARQKREQEDVMRQDKIQQIQAAKLALRRTKETMGNPNQFYRSIAIPETQIKLRLQKEEDKRKLQETRQKILAAKQMKSVKLIRAMKKIQSCESLTKKQQNQEQLNQQRPSPSAVDNLNSRPFTFPSRPQSYLKTDSNNNKVDIGSGTPMASTKDDEMDEMLEQLKQLRAENSQKRIDGRIQRAQAVGSRSSVRIIGANMNKSTDSLKNNGIYRHRSHYGIHV